MTFESFTAAERELRKSQAAMATIEVYGIKWRAIYVGHDHGFTYMPTMDQRPRNIEGTRYSDTEHGRFLSDAEKKLERPLSVDHAADLLVERFAEFANASEARTVVAAIQWVTA